MKFFYLGFLLLGCATVEKSPVLTTPSHPVVESATFCAMDVKACQDGSYVSRDPKKNCEFRKCEEFKSKNEEVEGVIVSYDCGDNCYLHIFKTDGTSFTALCASKLCNSWNEKVKMPSEFIGKKIKATVKPGTRFDGAGNIVDQYDAIIDIQVIR